MGNQRAATLHTRTILMMLAAVAIRARGPS